MKILLLIGIMLLSTTAEADKISNHLVVDTITDESVSSVYHSFEQQTLHIPIKVYANTTGPIALRGRMFQISDTLVAPTGTEIEVLSNQTLGEELTTHLDVFVDTPDITRETTFLLIFQAQEAGGSSWQNVGRTTFKVYPSDMLAPLRAWAHEHPLHIEDSEEKLNAFLDHHEIPYTYGCDVAPPVKKPGEQRLAIMSKKDRASNCKQKWRQGGFTIIVLEIDSLSELTANPLAPLAQKRFLEAIELNLSPLITTTGGIR